MADDPGDTRIPARKGFPTLTERLRRFLTVPGNRISTLWRQAELKTDQAWTLLRWKLGSRPSVENFDGDPRLALITVNFSTTRYLKLMLLTLCEQRDLHLVHRIVIVDNDSRDGGKPFLRRLAACVQRLHLVENRFFPTHARGLRKGVAFLDQYEASGSTSRPCNLFLFCDTDVIFLNPRTLTDLTAALAEPKAALAGELRRGLFPYPEVQASFFLLRRDCYARPETVPFVHHGAPAYWMQRSLWRAGLWLVDFPSNKGGYILHRGRSGVAAAREYRPGSNLATVPNYYPHYMGVCAGQQSWERTEQHYAKWLEPDRESGLLEHLERHLGILGGK